MSSTFNNEIYPKFFTEEDHKKTALTKLIDYVIKEHEICAMNIDTTQDLKYLLDMIKSCLDLPSSKSNQLRCREVHLNKQSLSSEFKRIRDQSDRDSIKAIQTTLGISKDDPEKLVHQITIDAKNINDIILNLPDDFIYYRGRGSQEEITQTHSPHFTPYIESAYSHSLRDRQGYSLVNYVLAKNLKEIIKKSQLKVHFDKSIGNIEIVSQGPANWYYSLELDKYYFLTK